MNRNDVAEANRLHSELVRVEENRKFFSGAKELFIVNSRQQIAKITDTDPMWPAFKALTEAHLDQIIKEKEERLKAL